MADTFPKTAAGIQHAQIDLDRGRELKLHNFVTEFMEEYDASGLTPSVISKIGVSNLGRFLHHVIFFDVVTFYMRPQETLAGNEADMLGTRCPDTRCCFNFGQMGPCFRHKIDDVGTCLGRLVMAPIFSHQKETGPSAYVETY